MQFSTRSGYMNHLNVEHDIAATIHMLDFPNRQIFDVSIFLTLFRTPIR